MHPMWYDALLPGGDDLILSDNRFVRHQILLVLVKHVFLLLS